MLCRHDTIPDALKFHIRPNTMKGSLALHNPSAARGSACPGKRIAFQTAKQMEIVR